MLQPLPIPHRPWQVIALDFKGPLPPSNFFNAVLVVTCKFTKRCHYIPTTMSVTSEKKTRLLIDHVFKLHGLPETIISDRDPRFTAGLWKAVFNAWGTKIAMSSSYHPQTDGQTERQMRVPHCWAESVRGQEAEGLVRSSVNDGGVLQQQQTREHG